MTPEVVAVGGLGLVAVSVCMAGLFRALHQRDQARFALGLARMELLETRHRWVACHRRVLELERGGKPVEVASEKWCAGNVVQYRVEGGGV